MAHTLLLQLIHGLKYNLLPGRYVIMEIQPVLDKATQPVIPLESMHGIWITWKIRWVIT